MRTFRTEWTTESNHLLPASSYWFDAESKPMVSTGSSGNRSNTVVVDAPPTSTAVTNGSVTNGTLSRMGTLLTSRILPALALAGLVLWQFAALVPELEEFNLHPGWMVLGECLRSALYALFLCFPIAAFLTHESPRSSDNRLLITCAALGATFLLVGLRLFVPSGPEIWHASPLVIELAIALTLGGVGLALASANSLGSSFSFVPQGRALVVRGPYRWVRHPIYLAELVMILGVTVVEPRVVPLLGAIVVGVLQVFRIRAEERLLRSTFPGFRRYASVTRYRLVPLLW